jgi:hypothetical protein
VSAEAHDFSCKELPIDRAVPELPINAVSEVPEASGKEIPHSSAKKLFWKRAVFAELHSPWNILFVVSVVLATLTLFDAALCSHYMVFDISRS